jgi:spore coat protein U-like protein
VCSLLLGGVALDARAAADCSITAANLNFGNYDPLSNVADDSAGSVTVTCRLVSQGAARINYTVSISPGVNSGSATSRQMAAGTARLGYNVFTDPARSQVWGSGAGGTVIATGAMTVGPGVGNGSGQQSVTHTVYGRIPQLQDAAPGNYADTLLITLTF